MIADMRRPVDSGQLRSFAEDGEVGAVLVEAAALLAGQLVGDAQPLQNLHSGGGRRVREADSLRGVRERDDRTLLGASGTLRAEPAALGSFSRILE